MSAGALHPLLVQSLVGLLCLIWGSTWIVIQEGLEDLPPFTSAAVRFALAFVVLCFVVPLLRRREGGGSPPMWLWASVGTLNFAASYGIVYTTETVLPSGLVSVLWAVFPLFVAVFGHWFLDERLRPVQWGGFVLGFCGVVALFFTDLQGGEFGSRAVPVALILILSPLVSAVGQVLMKRYGQGVSSLTLNRNAMGLGALWLGLLALGFEREAEMRWTGAAIGSIVYLAICGTALTFSLLYWLLRYAKATSLSVIAFVTPVIALALGAIFRDEELTATRVGGAGLVVFGVALASRAPRDEVRESGSQDRVGVERDSSTVHRRLP